VFGPHQNISDPYRNVVGIFIKNALTGKPLPIFGDGLQTRSFSYITDVARCIAAAPFVAAAKNQVYNIGGDESMTVKDLAGHVCRSLGVKEDLLFLPPRHEVMHAHSDHSRVRSAFPELFKFLTTIVDGLQITAEHVRQNPMPPITECPAPIEILDRLPPSWRSRL
jgi:UDP-glucose 4-epimerase